MSKSLIIVIIQDLCMTTKHIPPGIITLPL